MLKRLGNAALLGLAIVAGCSTTTERPRVIVTVDPTGQLQSQGFTLTQADLPAFAKETGNKPVILIPSNGPSYGKAVEAKEKLKAAGIGTVAIGGESGG